VYIHTYIHTHISALLVWRVLHDSDVIGFVVSDLVVRNVIGLKIGTTHF